MTDRPFPAAGQAAVAAGRAWPAPDSRHRDSAHGSIPPCNLTGHGCVSIICMNTRFISKAAKLVALAAILAGGTSLHAATASTAQNLAAPVSGPNEFQPMAFRDSAEAGLLRQAYTILATGDHDYKGHRVKAMHAVEAAGKLLGLDLAGDLRDHQPQFLSDDKLREAAGLIANVLAAAEVKNQKRITRHLNEAVKQINIALAIK